MMVEYLGCYGGGVSGLLWWWSIWVVMMVEYLGCYDGGVSGLL